MADGTLTFAPGETSKQVSITVLGDSLDEMDEWFTVRLSNPTNAAIADADGQVRILDDDEPPILRVSDARLLEGNQGDVATTVTVSLDHPLAAPVTVDWQTIADTAEEDDFVVAHGQVTFAPGETSKQVWVTVHGDTLYESDQTFFVHLDNAQGAGIADADGVVTIDDDDIK
jgi:hypothetical protein